MNPPIVLLTDFGLSDQYAGLLKAAIVRIHHKATILDLCHGVLPQNIIHGAILLEVSHSFFPKGSIFVCVVDPGVGTRRKIVCVKTSSYFFIGPDNGVLSLAIRRQNVIKIRSVENDKFFLQKKASSTFQGRDIMAPAAAHLARNAKLFDKLGPIVAAPKLLRVSPVIKLRKGLQGNILYFDHYGNAITNIKWTDASPSFWQKADVRVKKKSVGKIQKTYGAGSSLLPLFNSFGQLEIAQPSGSAQKSGSLKAGDLIEVTQSG